MLFEIDDSVADLLSEPNLPEDDRRAINHIAVGAMEGSHRITGRRKALQRLADTPGLGLREKAAFARAASRVAEDGQLPKKLKVVGRIVAGAERVPTATLQGDRRVITFPLRWFDVTAKIQPVILLAENLSDVIVYRIIGEAGGYLGGYGYVNLSASNRHGGGSTIGQVLHDISRTDALCVCLVDSDKASPLGAEGDTALGVAEFGDCADYPLIGVLLTSGRDLENALPNTFYRNTYGTGTQYEAMTNVLIELTESGEHDLRRHIDIKKGLVLRDMFGWAQGSPEGAFWTNCLPVLLQIRGIDGASLACTGSAVCPKTRRSDCSCQIVPGNSANVLETFGTVFGTIDRFAVVKGLDGSVRDEWESLGATIASWCFGDSKTRS